MDNLTYLAGVLLSSPPPIPLTLTAILTGFLKPTLTISPTASLTLALNRPVRRCLGSLARIFCRSSLKPRSSNLSASSSTKISNEDWGQWTCGDDKSSRSRPGVDISRFGDILRKWARSWAGVVAPPSRSCGTTLRVGGECRVVECASAAPLLSSDGLSVAAEGPWKAKSERRTAWICVASSL
jgi:hypothetical protein